MIAQRGAFVFGAEQTSLLKYRHRELYEILKTFVEVERGDLASNRNGNDPRKTSIGKLVRQICQSVPSLIGSTWKIKSQRKECLRSPLFCRAHDGLEREFKFFN
jgi:hypothetical protein